MIDEPLSRGPSPVHRRDPRFRLVACLALSLVAALAVNSGTPLVILAAGLVMTGLARLPLGLVARRFTAVNAFVAFLWLVLPFTTPGTPVTAAFHGIAATREGVALATLITLKANAVFFCVLSLLATIPAPALGGALRAVGVPDKFAFLFLFTYRYLHVIHEEYGRLATAARLRGFAPATSLHAYRTYAALVAMVLVRAYDRSQRVYQAMLLRGFSGRFASLDGFRAGRGDLAFLLAALAVAVAGGALDLTYWRGHV